MFKLITGAGNIETTDRWWRAEVIKLKWQGGGAPGRKWDWSRQVNDLRLTQRSPEVPLKRMALTLCWIRQANWICSSEIPDAQTAEMGRFDWCWQSSPGTRYSTPPSPPNRNQPAIRVTGTSDIGRWKIWMKIALVMITEHTFRWKMVPRPFLDKFSFIQHQWVRTVRLGQVKSDQTSFLPKVIRSKKIPEKIRKNLKNPKNFEKT